ncbi:hypothetical protein HK103_005352 [Boothiomyces macroporosus]|uniref:Uncharacterized protein n=1 Tax=Boothiomyces macroporosus TaxID=261099 RepID=A0AAD5Y617_9FUNG|nr:hypothetical protein HK103_005352 [Boothiomyces macroporosus]
MSNTDYEICFGDGVKPVQATNQSDAGFLPVDLRKAKKAVAISSQPVVTQCPEIETNEAYINRFRKPNVAVLAGAPLPLKPRPQPFPPNDITMDPAESDEPSLFSELVRGGQHFQDPYATFFDDIKGWDEDTSEDLVLKLINDSSRVSYRYLTYDSNQETVGSGQTIKKKIARRKKSAIAPAINIALQNTPMMENEEELDNLSENKADSSNERKSNCTNECKTADVKECNEGSPAATADMVESSLLVTTKGPPIEKKLRITFSGKYVSVNETEHIPPLFNPSKELLMISSKNDPDIPLSSTENTHINRIATLRKKLCTSAAPQKTLNLKSKEKSLGITCLKGKKYYCQETETIKNLRAKTADPKLSSSRTVLPIISTPAAYGLPDSPQNQSWGIIKGVSQTSISTSSSPSNQKYPSNLQNIISHSQKAADQMPWLADKGPLAVPATPAVRRGPKKLSAFGFKTVRVPSQPSSVKLTEITQESIPTISTINSNYDWADLDMSNLRIDHKFPKRSFRTQIHLKRISD